MPPSLNFTTTLLLLTVVLVLLPTETYAFGAGDIPDFAYLSVRSPDRTLTGRVTDAVLFF
jgi:hypothetical protein